MLQTKARLLNYNIDPNDVGRESNKAYQSVSNVAGATNVINTLAEVAKQYQLKDDERNLIQVQRELNKINSEYGHKFNKIENYSDTEKMDVLETEYMDRVKALQTRVANESFTKTARQQANDMITGVNDKMEMLQQNGWEIRQEKEDMSLLVQEKSEITNMIQLEIEQGIEDPQQLDDLMIQYNDNLDMLVKRGVISEAEAKADLTANYTNAVDKGILLKALEQLQLDPNFELMTLEEQLDAHTRVLDSMKPEVVLEAVRQGIKDEGYEGRIDMAQVETALLMSHKAGTQANNQLLSAVRLKQQKAKSKFLDDEAKRIKQEQADALKTEWAKHDRDRKMREGMSWMEAQNQYNREMRLMPEYNTIADVLNHTDYIETTVGVSPDVLIDINNDIILPDPIMGKAWFNDTANIWADDTLPNDIKYRDINARILTASAGDSRATEYLIKDVAGRIEGLDVGTLYLQLLGQGEDPIQKATYIEQNESILRNGLREDVFDQQNDLLIKYNASGKKKKKEMTDDMIGIAEQMSEKGVALTRFSGVPLYSFVSETNSTDRRGPQSFILDVMQSLGRKRDFTYREVNSERIDKVLDRHNISAEEFRVPDPASPNGYSQVTKTDLIEMIDYKLKNDPASINRMNSIMLDLYVNNTGRTQGTDILASDITDKSWGFVQPSDISKEIKQEALDRFIEYEVLESIPFGNRVGRPTPKPFETMNRTPQLNYMKGIGGN